MVLYLSRYTVLKGQTRLRRVLYNRIYLRLGDDSDEGTPLPIPNRVVKLVSADGTAAETPWESRSSPIFYIWIRGRAFSAALSASGD